MIVRITRAKVGHCQTPIYDTRLMAGVVLYGKQRKEKENTMERKSSENKSENKMGTNRDRNKGIGISKGVYKMRVGWLSINI